MEVVWSQKEEWPMGSDAHRPINRTMYLQAIDSTSTSYNRGFGKWLHLGTSSPKDTPCEELLVFHHVQAAATLAGR